MKLIKIYKAHDLSLVVIEHNGVKFEYSLEHSLWSPSTFNKELEDIKRWFFDYEEVSWNDVYTDEDMMFFMGTLTQIRLYEGDKK